MKTALLCLLVIAFASSPLPAAELRDFQGTFKETVIQITFMKVGDKLTSMYVGDVPDSRHYLAVNEKFVAGQTIAYSVFGKADYRVSFWGSQGQLEVKKAEPLDEPAGKGFRLSYDDGTVVEIIA